MPVRWFVSVALIAVLSAAAACGEDPSSDAAPGPSSGTSTGPTLAPQSSGGPSSAASVVPESLRFTATTLDGTAFDGAALAGKPVVLWFWAPWCPRCRAQAAATAKVASDFRGRATVVGVAGLDKAEAMRSFVADQKVGGFPQVSDEAGVIWKRFGITEQSVYVVLDANGKRVFAGNLPSGDGLSGKVAELVG